MRLVDYIVAMVQANIMQKHGELQLCVGCKRHLSCFVFHAANCGGRNELVRHGQTMIRRPWMPL